MSGIPHSRVYGNFANLVKIRSLGTNGIPDHATALYIQDNRRRIGSFQPQSLQLWKRYSAKLVMIPTPFLPRLISLIRIVCLSILNTWEGATSEKWQPTISSLLQVFVSIQSMILCDNPWYNEPGRREGTQKKQSEDFNTRVRLNNVRFAMLDWIKDPEKRNGIWKV